MDVLVVQFCQGDGSNLLSTSLTRTSILPRDVIRVMGDSRADTQAAVALKTGLPSIQYIKVRVEVEDNMQINTPLQ